MSVAVFLPSDSIDIRIACSIPVVNISVWLAVFATELSIVSLNVCEDLEICSLILMILLSISGISFDVTRTRLLRSVNRDFNVCICSWNKFS